MKNFKAGEFESWNDEMVRKYDPDRYHRHPNPLIRYIEARRVRTIKRFSDLTNTDSLLEVGCGAGNILEGLDCGRIVGIDLSMFILEKARQKKIDNLCLLKGSADLLPFKDRSFDRVICSEVLEHVPDPRGVLAEIWRVVKDNGVFTVSVPNENLINSIKKVLIKIRMFRFLSPRRKKSQAYNVPDDMTDEWHLHELNLEILREMLRNGFKVIKQTGIPFNFLPLRYVVKCKKALP